MSDNLGGFTLMPCAKDVCQECAVDHPANEPHNAQSLYYQYNFRDRHGRWPTWEDALAHCDEATRSLWRQELEALGAWTAQP